MTKNTIPTKFYGVLHRSAATTSQDRSFEEFRNVGFTTLDSGLSSAEIKEIAAAFNETHKEYIQEFGEERLLKLDEYYSIRALLTKGGGIFLRLATNERLLKFVDRLIDGKYILNQQNGIINPPGHPYNQGAWHRDLPFQHYTSSAPLAVNALFCIDDFTAENGATFVLPASHKAPEFPSEDYLRRYATQIEASAGSFLVLDAMLFHSGGFNNSQLPRRAVNHLYTIPFFRQQIDFSTLISGKNLSEDHRKLLGLDDAPCRSIEEYLNKRLRK